MYRSILLVVSALTLSASPARAQDVLSKWNLRLQGVVSDSPGSFGARGGGTALSVDTGPIFGVGLSVEYRVSKVFGLELSALYTLVDLDVEVVVGEVSVRADDRLDAIPVTIGPTFHLRPGGGLDLYLSPTVAWVSYGVGAEVGFEYGYGLNLGLDIPFGNRGWAVTTGLRYLAFEDGALEIDPMITAGIRRGF